MFWLMFIILILMVSLPLITFFMVNIVPKSNVFKQECKRIIHDADFKIEFSINGKIIDYIYYKSDSYGKERSQERYFENAEYKSTRHIDKNISESMQERINEVEKEFKDTKIEITYKE